MIDPNKFARAAVFGGRSVFAPPLLGAAAAAGFAVVAGGCFVALGATLAAAGAAGAEVAGSCPKKVSISPSKQPSAVILCLTAPSGSMDFILVYLDKPSFITSDMDAVGAAAVGGGGGGEFDSAGGGDFEEEEDDDEEESSEERLG